MPHASTDAPCAELPGCDDPTLTADLNTDYSSCTDHSYGSICYATCPLGYTGAGDAMCNSDGHWIFNGGCTEGVCPGRNVLACAQCGPWWDATWYVECCCPGPEQPLGRDAGIFLEVILPAVLTAMSLPEGRQ